MTDSKRFISLLLSLIMVLSVFTVVPAGVSAATTDGFIPEANKFYFDVDGTGWTMTSKDKVAFYIAGGDFGTETNATDPLAWGSKYLIGKATEGESGIWEIDPFNITDKNGVKYTLTPGVQYKIIFVRVNVKSWKDQTCSVFFTTDCLGHVAYSDGTMMENDVDSSKTSLAAYWKGIDPAENGPALCITSLGNVVGSCVEQGKTKYDLFVSFISEEKDDFNGKTGLQNARYYTVEQAKTKTEQKMIDDIGAALDLTKNDVAQAFADTGVETVWSADASTLPNEAPTEAPTETPTEVPTEEPTWFEEPTEAPTEEPTWFEEPTVVPTVVPTEVPIEEPSRFEEPTEAPTEDTPHEHNLFYVAYYPPTYKDGHMAYYQCAECRKMYADATACCEITEADVRLPVGEIPSMPDGITYDYTGSYTVEPGTPYCEDACDAWDYDDTQTIYFQAPEDWENKYNTFPGPDLTNDEPYMHVCIYWWWGVGEQWPNGNSVKWVGYQTHLVDKEQRIYSAQVPKHTPTVIWNNGVNGGMDQTNPKFTLARQVMDLSIEGAEPGYYDTLPEGTPDPNSMDGCIAIINYSNYTTSPLTGMDTYEADWYVYYGAEGSGCYGYYPKSSDYYWGINENCINPEHRDEDGCHITPAPYIPDGNGGDKIYFYAPSAGWQDASNILFYIYDLEEGQLAPWGSKKQLGGTDEGGGVWSFDAAALGVTEGHIYGLVLNNLDTTAQTYDLLLDTSCFGDIAYCTGNRIEIPIDSAKTALESRWKYSSLGPRLQITSIGNVVGEDVPACTSAYQMFVNFLASDSYDSLTNALIFNGKDAKTTIDDVANKLGLTEDDIRKAIIEARDVGHSETGDKKDWTEAYSIGTQPDTDPAVSLNFDMSTTDWEDTEQVCFYIYEPGGEPLNTWGSKKTLGEETSPGIWSFDPAAHNLDLVDGKQYAVIFYKWSSSNSYTASLLFDTSCLGDTAYCTGEYLQNPVNEGYIDLDVKWTNSPLGVPKEITIMGTVIGDTVPDNTSAYQMFVDFLASGSNNGMAYALTVNGKDAVTAINELAQALGLTQEDINTAIIKARDQGNAYGDTHDWTNEYPVNETDPYGYVIGDFYLVGTIDGEDRGITNVDPALRFKKTKNADMQLSWIKMQAGDKVNAARYNGDGIFTVYPDGVGNEKAIGDSGFYNFYFKPYELGNANYWYLTPGFVGAAKEKTDDDTGVNIEVPDNIEIIVDPLNEEDIPDVVDSLPKGSEVLGVYSIILTDNGEVVQPENFITVKIPCNNPRARVYRKEANGTLTDMNAVYIDGFLVFQTDHFSIYVLSAPETTGVTVSGAITSYIDDSDVTVKLTGKDNDFIGEDTGKADYTITNVPAGTYELTVSKNKHVTRTYELTVGTEDVAYDVTICPIGDANLSGVVDMRDYAAAYKHVMKTKLLTGYALDCANANGKGDVDMKDYAAIYKHVMKTKPLF